MTSPTMDRTPAPWAVVEEQVRAVGLAVRREALVGGAVMGLPWLILALLIRGGLVVSDGQVWDAQPLDPGEAFPSFAALLAVFFALAVWKGERPFGDTPLWSLPVDHRRHAFAKVTAGWVWLMVLLGALWLWIVLMALASGGTLGAEEVRLLVLDPAGAVAGAPGATTRVVWATPWWEWVAPLGAATVGYLVASAIILATAHPVPWGLGLWFTALALGGLLYPLHLEWLNGGLDGTLRVLGVWDGTRMQVLLPSGEPATAWRVLPTAGMWASAAAIWIGVGTAGVLAALARPRDH